MPAVEAWLGGHMDGSDACAGIHAQLGVYVTGSITSADRAAVVRHLAACADCRDELADLASLPALLRRPSAQEAARSPEPPQDAAEAGPALLSGLLGRVTRRRRTRRLLLAAVAGALAVVAALGWVLRLAEPPPPGPAVAGTVLETEQIHGVKVLTDAEGYTLYWFGPDTATKSACDAACARHWPPVTGPAVAGLGVTGAIGAITRPDGSLQASYDGHPLYTAAADTAPGQTRGNGVRDSGGVWHEVTVPGRPTPASRPSAPPSPTPTVARTATSPAAPAGGYGY
jgi:predicted lipoprotein with Yx(FWY)xxD motif